MSFRDVADLDRARLVDLGVAGSDDGDPISLGAPAPRFDGVRGFNGLSVNTVMSEKKYGKKQDTKCAAIN